MYDVQTLILLFAKLFFNHSGTPHLHGITSPWVQNGSYVKHSKAIEYHSFC